MARVPFWKTARLERSASSDVKLHEPVPFTVFMYGALVVSSGAVS
jgi:hypothetical protein